MADEQTPSDEARKDYSKAERDEMAKNGQALADGSFPIANETDLKNAIQAYGRASDKAAAKAHIIKRARALGLTSLLPDDWTQQNSADDENLEERAVSPEVERRRVRAGELDGAREVRHFEAQNVEIRELSDGTYRFSGYASVTEHPYEVADFTETIARGAFKRTLGEDPDVVLLVNHGEGGGLPLARTKSGTMTLMEDARGLRVDADLNPQDPDVRSLVPKMQRGDVDQMSFAFRATDQEWNKDYTQRTIRSVALHRGDVSIVTMGANPATSSTLTARQVTDALVEVRAGKSISSANMSTLSRVLELVASADEAVDEAQPLLAGLMGVPNPDADHSPSDGNDDGGGGGGTRALVAPRLDYTTEARAWFDAERERR